MSNPPPPLLEAVNICKAFAGVQALAEVSLVLRAGEVHALMGENGAGKSTLMRVLAGLHPPDAGEIRLHGRRVAVRSPHEAMRLGIAMIHQELMPIPDLTVAENVTLGRESASRLLGRIDRRAQREEAGRLLGLLGADVPLRRRMRDLSVAQMQTVEIAKALGCNARIVIMDEPTAAISGHEVEALFRVIGTLRRRGAAVVYITHRMDEVFRVAQTVTVLRDGRHVATCPAGELDDQRLIGLMVGRELKPMFAEGATGVAPPEPVDDEDDRVRGAGGDRSQGTVPIVAAPHEVGPIAMPFWPRNRDCPPRMQRSEQSAPSPREQARVGEPGCSDSRNHPPYEEHARETVPLAVRGLGRAGAFCDVSLEVRRGEVLGLAGLMGAGRTEVAEALFGLKPAHDGIILVRGKPVRIRRPADAIRCGIGMVTEDRKGYGLVPTMSVRQNITLASLRACCTGPLVRHRREAAAATAGIGRFNIRTATDRQPVGQLSGGNQQKVVIARTLLAEPSIVILDEPTRGIDVGAKREVYEIIARLAREGRAVILISSELPEVLSLSDRLLVMRQGRVAAELDPSRTSQEEVLKHAMPE